MVGWANSSDKKCLAFFSFLFHVLTTVRPLLVQRCNGTIAGLGFLEVSMVCPCKSPPWAAGQCSHCLSPIGVYDTINPLILTSSTKVSMQIQWKQASSTLEDLKSTRNATPYSKNSVSLMTFVIQQTVQNPWYHPPNIKYRTTPSPPPRTHPHSPTAYSSRARIFKRLRIPGIDSKESIPRHSLQIRAPYKYSPNYVRSWSLFSS